MKIVLTGNKGFIGTHLEDSLRILAKKNNWKILGVDKKNNVNIVHWNKFYNFVKKFGKPDLIIHLAATCSTQASIDRPREDFKDNVIGSFNVCELARLTGAKILYTSSCKVSPNREGSRAPYGLSKLVGELYIKEYSLDFGIEYVINRPGTIYGPGQEGSPESGWLAWFIKAKLDNLPIKLYGSGKQIRDVLWIDDYVKLIINQIKHWDKYKGKIFDVGGGKENAINLLQTLKFIKYDNYDFAPKRIGDVDRFVSDNRLVKKINKWNPKMNWKRGIKLTIKHYEKERK